MDQAETGNDQQPAPVKRKASVPGILSLVSYALVIGFLLTVVGLFLLVVVLGGNVSESGMAAVIISIKLLSILYIPIVILNIMGVILAGIGLAQKKKKRLVAVIGIVLNGGCLLVYISYYLLTHVSLHIPHLYR